MCFLMQPIVNIVLQMTMISQYYYDEVALASRICEYIHSVFGANEMNG